MWRTPGFKTCWEKTGVRTPKSSRLNGKWQLEIPSMKSHQQSASLYTRTRSSSANVAASSRGHFWSTRRGHGGVRISCSKGSVQKVKVHGLPFFFSHLRSTAWDSKTGVSLSFNATTYTSGMLLRYATIMLPAQLTIITQQILIPPNDVLITQPASRTTPTWSINRIAAQSRIKAIQSTTIHSRQANDLL